jgi:hypothetical protein
MIVCGIEVSSGTVAKAISDMRLCERFTYMEMQTRLIHHGCDKQAAYRAADRVLQRLRKSGEIVYRKNAWEWVT